MAGKNQPDVVVVGARRHPLRDAFHFILQVPWWGVLGVIVGSFLGVNALFALAYLATGGVAEMPPGSFPQAFFFSVQTMGTIGYGAMHPVSTAANLLVVAESTVSLIMTALATGIIFARFSRSPGQIIFSNAATISPMNGVPTLAFRIGNDRSSTVFEARVEVSVVRTERTAEGMTFYRLHDARLVRQRSPALARSWVVLHPITEDSPLRDVTDESARAEELEIMVTVVGTDDTSLQPANGRRTYKAHEIIWGARYADVLSELPDGRMQLDVSRFHDIVPTEPTPAFPYPRVK